VVDRAQLAETDLQDADAVRSLVARSEPECAIHLGWYVVPGKFWTARENLDCVGMTLSLAQALAEAGCRRLVGGGSCTEYDWDYGYLSETVTPLRPRTLYGVAKNATRAVLEAFCRRTSISFAWARVFYLYGPGEDPARLVPAVTLALLKGEVAKCTEGSQVRDFLVVEDVASAILAVAESKFEGSVNIGSGEPASIRRIAELIGDSLGKREQLAFGAIKSDPSDPPFLLADVRRLRDEIGWKPSHTLDEALPRTVEWWKNNPV
jgi:nucleoside-diphosphate-sugar epimerase